MRVLRALLGFEDVRLARQVGSAKAARDEFAHVAHGILGDARGIGTHVGDETCRALGPKLETFVQALGQAHGPLGREAQLARSLLLEAGRDERRRRVLAPLFALDGRHFGRGLADEFQRMGSMLFADQDRFFAVDLDHARGERRRAFALDLEFYGPVFLGLEGLDLFLALD